MAATSTSPGARAISCTWHVVGRRAHQTRVADLARARWSVRITVQFYDASQCHHRRHAKRSVPITGVGWSVLIAECMRYTANIFGPPAIDAGNEQGTLEQRPKMTTVSCCRGVVGGGRGMLCLSAGKWGLDSVVDEVEAGKEMTQEASGVRALCMNTQGVCALTRCEARSGQRDARPGCAHAGKYVVTTDHRQQRGYHRRVGSG